MSDNPLHQQLRCLAEKYETAEFINGDPSCFMHLYDDPLDIELVAFVASTLSYGSRRQFLPKIEWLVNRHRQHGISFHKWIASGAFRDDIADDSTRCFYRLYTFATIHRMLCALQTMVVEHGSMKQYLIGNAPHTPMTCREAVELIVAFFAKRGIEGIIPKNTTSSCKRICMFLRWMVRDNSPVDTGIWHDIVDKRTLIIPLDTHVVNEACRLGMLQSRSASMSAAVRLTAKLSEIFPEDPLKGDFALFGTGVDDSRDR